jgi:hypothetical protein
MRIASTVILSESAVDRSPGDQFRFFWLAPQAELFEATTVSA